MYEQMERHDLYNNRRERLWCFSRTFVLRYHSFMRSSQVAILTLRRHHFLNPGMMLYLIALDSGGVKFYYVLIRYIHNTFNICEYTVSVP